MLAPLLVLSPLCFLLGTPARAPTLAPAALGPRLASRMSAVDEICDTIPDSTVCEQIEADADAVFAVIDVDGDGGITRSELSKHLTAAGYAETAVDTLFNKLDTNKDDLISKEELREGFMKFTPLRAAPGLGAYNAEFVEEIHADADTLFQSIDADNSGTISKDELRDHLKRESNYSFKAISKLYKLLDVNKDGEIERDELRAAFVKYSALRMAIGEGPNFK